MGEAGETRGFGLGVNDGEPREFCRCRPFQSICQLGILANMDEFNISVIDDAFVVVFHQLRNMTSARCSPTGREIEVVILGDFPDILRDKLVAFHAECLVDEFFPHLLISK